jgi:CheY-like chemotaxis protein
MHNKKLVLIMENDRVIRILTAELILEGGVNVVDAAEGEEAIELHEKRATEVAALVTDVRMPGKCRGLDPAQRVASRWPWISILVTSGYYGERSPGLPEEAQFLSKPWEPEVILDFVQ